MILVIDDYDGMYGKFWVRLGGEITEEVEILFRDPASIKLVCFTGGSDVSPELYGHENLGSSCSKARDEREVLIFQQAQKHRIPMTGICRGSQFLNVMCGGTMVQDLKANHGGSPHECQTMDCKKFEVTSSHHQMSVLGDGGVLLGNSTESIPVDAAVYDGDLRDLDEKHVRWDCNGHYDLYVTEAFAYPEQRIFAVQHHPEWQSIEEEAPQWTLNKTAEFCWGEECRERGLDEMTELLGT